MSPRVAGSDARTRPHMDSEWVRWAAGSAQRTKPFNRGCVRGAPGAALGSTIGILFGGLSVLGPGSKGRRLQVLGKTCAQSAAMFGTFLAAGLPSTLLVAISLLIYGY